MVMMSLELTDTLPFKTVFLHAMVRDGDGQKVSARQCAIESTTATHIVNSSVRS